MSLRKFIENKLAEIGKDEKWLVDECGFTGYMLPRIRAGGVIQNATKQKLAKAFKCSIGDINAAIAQIDPPEQKTELPAAAKEVIDAYMDDGPAKVTAEKIKWYPGQDAIDTPQSGPAAVITEPKVTALDVEAYKAKLKDTLMKLTVAEDWPTSNILFEKFGRAVAKDLLE